MASPSGRRIGRSAAAIAECWISRPPAPSESGAPDVRAKLPTDCVSVEADVTEARHDARGTRPPLVPIAIVNARSWASIGSRGGAFASLC